LQDALALSRQRDAEIRAWAHLTEADPSAGAAGVAANPLAGVPFGVKDVIDVAGMPTRSGSDATSDVPCEVDAACVALLRQAGAVPIGKTVTAEFAYMAPGPTRNPHRLEHTPGGSSSGSAAAVAAGMLELAIGTQTGGSIIRPAAYCGVIGFKPTFGRVHRQGMHVHCDSLDTIGWFTRTLDQSTAIAQLLLGDGAATRPQRLAADTRRAPRVALLPSRVLASLSPAADAALTHASRRLRDAGVELVEPECDTEQAELLRLHGEIMHAELARGMLSQYRRHEALLSPSVRDAIVHGLTIAPADYARHQQARSQLAQRWQERFANVDFLLTPSAPSEAPAGLASTGPSVFNRIWSLLGWPCVHVPTGKTAQGLPVGVQCVALPDRDLALLEWAQWLQRLLPAQPEQYLL